MSKVFGGQPENYLEFVHKTLELGLHEVLCTYAKENNVDLEEKVKQNFEKKLMKLSFFFNKSAEEFQTLVQENPKLHFRGLIKLLKEKGAEDYNGENFKQMREKMMEVKQERKDEKIQKKGEKVPDKKVEQEEKLALKKA